MKLLDILLESSGDLKRHRDLFMDRWKKIMKSKPRKSKLDYTKQLINDMLTKEEIKFLILQLQQKTK